MACRTPFATMCVPLLAWTLLTTASAQMFNHNSYVGQEPPELVSQTEHWLGWYEKVTLNNLKGSVVWLQFNF